ncbi:MAG: hypothetical protein MZV64_69360 [Ignavibacteriales bacterium]|nr:hypothetical protein [Ignavibacteriales bacterium]
MAIDVPSFGYKKYLLKPKSVSKEFPSGLIKTDNSIQNQFYKITFDTNNPSVKSLIDKKTGKELINNNNGFGLAFPTIEKFQLNQNHSSISGSMTSYEIIDERPVRLTFRIKRENDVIEIVDYSLLDGIDKVFVNANVNLESLKPTKNT